MGGPERYYADGGDEPGRWLGRTAHRMGLDGTVRRDDFAAVLSGRDPATGERLITAQGSAGHRPTLGAGSVTRLGPGGDALIDVTDAAGALGVSHGELERMLDVGTVVALGRLAAPAEHPDGHPGGHPGAGLGDREHPGGYPVRAPEQPGASFLVPVVDPDGSRWVTGTELARCEAARQEGVASHSVRALGAPEDLLSLAEAARLAGVTARYLRRVAKYHEDNRIGIEQSITAGRHPRQAYLAGNRGTRGRWLVTREHLAEFLDRRRPPAVRVAYDLTLTTEKSLGVLALLGDAPVRAKVLGAIQDANDWALRWIEDRAVGRIDGEPVPAEGLVVASFRHLTSRGLDPFPHHHNVVVNTVRAPDGSNRSLWSRCLYQHAQAASALATAEMRHRLSASLGVRWRPGRNAARHGLTPDRLHRVVQRDVQRDAGREVDRELVFGLLAAPEGICAGGSVFTRAEALATLVNVGVPDDTGEAQPLLVGAQQMVGLCEEFLASRRVVQLTHGDDPLYSTREMLAVQQRIATRYTKGLHHGAHQVDDRHLALALAKHPHLNGEQLEMVRSWCQSGHRVQAAVGRAGAGKTTTVAACAHAWQAAGYRVVGAAVKGEAARTLAAATGIDCETVAWYTAHTDPETFPLDDRTILVIDEASTVPDRSLDQLMDMAATTGASIRLVGDPAQHGAIAAGGMFRVVCQHHRVADRLRRSTGELTAWELAQGGGGEARLGQAIGL